MTPVLSGCGQPVNRPQCRNNVAVQAEEVVHAT